jgi:hypothetical protein
LLAELFGRLLSRRMDMFGFQGGEDAHTVARKQGYMREAQQRWGGLTTYGLSTVRNEDQLCVLVKERLSLPLAQVASDVQSWACGKQF